MQVSVITLVTDNVVELAETLSSQRVAHAAAPKGLELQIVIVAPEFSEPLQAVLEREESLGLASIETATDRAVGIAAAFNVGLVRATGELITVLNAGDLWLPETLVEVSKTYERSPECVIHSAITFENAQGERYLVASDPKKLAQRMTVFHPTLFVPIAIQQQVGKFDERYELAMDSNWCHRAVGLGVRFSEAAQSLAVMRLGGRSDIGYAGALYEFRMSVIETGLNSPWLAHWHYWRVLLGKRLSSRRLIRRLITGWRAFVQRTGQS